MINIEQILSYYPEQLQKTKKVHLIREYLQFMLLNRLSNSKFAKYLCFIGGTNLRLIHGIDRFSEDLDFDNKNMNKEKFIKMTDFLIKHLQNTGLEVIADDKLKDNKLAAYRRNLVFPQFLYNNGLSPFRDAKFLIKIESQDQGVEYKPDIILMKGCGYIFNFLVPPNDVLCSMKIAALLSRKKGRDFYDTMFLLTKTQPNYNFLGERTGISTPNKLKEILMQIEKSTNLKHKSKDFEHLIIDKSSSKKILLFRDFISSNF